jgi:competence protein ComEC
MKSLMRHALLVGVLTFCCLSAKAAATLEIYAIDVEGGQATLFVSPSGESMLVDTGWPGFNGRDADRICAAARAAGVTRLNYVVITHYHLDHVGGVEALAARIPIGTFVDHGKSVETGPGADDLYGAYVKVRDPASHLIVRAGDRIPIEGIDVQVVSSAGQVIDRPLLAAGALNPYCGISPHRQPDPTEDAQSVGMVISFGKFHILDLGDLTWNKELTLVCPRNNLGSVDVYLTTHHGQSQSNPTAIVDALKPRVAITDNGATKGGSEEALHTIRTSPGIEDVWQLHYSQNATKETNAPEPFLVNVDGDAPASWIKVSASFDGSFTVTNSRNGMSKTYPPRH